MGCQERPPIMSRALKKGIYHFNNNNNNIMYILAGYIHTIDPLWDGHGHQG